jgi:DNA-directed RNA polymerase specialized sigma24 family protein
MAEEIERKFEDCIDVIENAIRKQRSRWRLDCISWFDFEDVEQVIKLHIYKKWNMWDQKRPLEPWINIIVSNQIKNLVRNHYGNYVKPCVSCEFNMGDDSCSFTSRKVQNRECDKFAKWEKTKKSAFSLRVAVSADEHMYEIGSAETEDNVFFHNSVERLNIEMKKELSEIHYEAYKMLYFEDDSTEEDVANLMGYKTNEKKRKAGYRQVKNLKKIFAQKAEKIMRENDIIISGEGEAK